MPREIETLFPGLLQLKNNGLGKDVYRLIKEDFGRDNRVLFNVDVPENTPVKGSNPYMRWAVGPRLRKLCTDYYGYDVELLKPAVSEYALNIDRLADVASTYEDLGLVVYSLNHSNDRLAQRLVSQAKERGISIELPMVFYHLKTVKDSEFPDGLTFDLDDIAVAYHVPILLQILLQKENIGDFDANDPQLLISGFPSELGKGGRTLFAAKEGLKRFFRDRHYLSADNNNLSSSTDSGRISFVKKGAPTQNLEAHIIDAVNAERERQRQIAEVEAWATRLHTPA